MGGAQGRHRRGQPGTQLGQSAGEVGVAGLIRVTTFFSFMRERESKIAYSTECRQDEGAKEPRLQMRRGLSDEFWDYINRCTCQTLKLF